MVLEKLKEKRFYSLNETYDKISAGENLELFDVLVQKMGSRFFRKLPGNPYDILNTAQNRERFSNLEVLAQIEVLARVVKVLKSNRTGAVDLSSFEKGSSQSATVRLSNNLANWSKSYTDVRIIDTDAAGLFETYSRNLLEFLK